MISLRICLMPSPSRHLELRLQRRAPAEYVLAAVPNQANPSTTG